MSCIWGDVFMQGAEARIYKTRYLDKAVIVKERFVKSYRHKDLDTRITMERIRSESKAIVRCKESGLHVPVVYLVDFNRRIIIMEDIQESESLKLCVIRSSQGGNDQSTNSFMLELATEIGKIIAKMHSINFVHGDLTTSNMLVKYDSDNHNWRIYVIDFGLSFSEASIEDKAVDIYVLERALLSTHSNVENFLNNILQSYTLNYNRGKEVLNKYNDVRARGRKRTMVG